MINGSSCEEMMQESRSKPLIQPQSSMRAIAFVVAFLGFRLIEWSLMWTPHLQERAAMQARSPLAQNIYTRDHKKKVDI